MTKSKSREFQHLIEAFLKIFSQKINESDFGGPQIPEMLHFYQFETNLSKSQNQAWLSFKWACSSFLGNNHHPHYEITIKILLNSYQRKG